MREIWVIYFDKSNRKVFSEFLSDIVGITGDIFLSLKNIKYNYELNAVCKALLTSFADGVFLYSIIFLVISCRGPPLINLKQKQIDRRKYNDYYN